MPKPVKNENRVKSQVTVNGARLSQDDEYLVLFESPQVITNGTVQKDGSYYDIASLDVTAYTGKVYGNHEYGFQDVLGTVVGLTKDENAPNGGAVTISGIQFARNHDDARLARDLMVQDLTELSIGTIGFEDEDGARYNHRLIDLSLVGMGNNDFTTTNLAEVAVKNGIDISSYKLNKGTSMDKTKKNDAPAPQPNQSDEAAEEQKQEVEEKVQEQTPATEPVPAPQAAPAPGEGVEEPAAPVAPAAPAGAPASPAGDDKSENAFVPKKDFDEAMKTLNSLKVAMNTPAKPQAGGVEDNNSLQIGGSRMLDTVKNMTAGERLAKQLELERAGQKHSDEYRAINEFNAEELVSKNYMDMSDGSLAGLVPPMELVDRIVQRETNYDNVLARFGFDQMGLTYGWNLGIGNIEFTPLGYCAPSPESDLETELQTRTQERLATHSVICDATTRFSPANVINMVSNRYQSAYKKALALGLIAELEVAVDQRVAGLDRAAGHIDIAADATASVAYPGSGQTDRFEAIQSLLDATDNGLYIMNTQSAGKLIIDLGITQTGVGGNEGLLNMRNYDGLANALGAPVLVVSKDLMPTLGSGGTVVIPRTSNAGGNVTVNHAVFFIDPSNWQGVTNGGLEFDIDSFAPYEVTVSKTVSGGGGGTVSVVETRSAKQRGETVLFGNMYRGGGVLDWRQIAGVLA